MSVAANVVTRVDRASDVPGFCMNLVSAVRAQPRQTEGTHAGYKVLLRNTEDIQLFDKIHQMAQYSLGKSAPSIVAFVVDKQCTFGVGNEYTSYMRTEPDKKGIRLSENEEQILCSDEALEEAYRKVIKALQAGWQVSEPKDYPDLLIQKDPKYYTLLLKPQCPTDTTEVIFSIARRCGVGGFIKGSAYSYRRQRDGHAIHNTYGTYIWVLNEYYDNVVTKMGFVLDDEPQVKGEKDVSSS